MVDICISYGTVCFDGEEENEVEIHFGEKTYVLPRHMWVFSPKSLNPSVLLHSSRLCDAIRRNSMDASERMVIRVNRECRFFSTIVDYFYTGYVRLPEKEGDVHVLEMATDKN